jgi:hypothetical protein
MKDESNNDESLRPLLKEWRVNASLPPRFQEDVWRRIERQQAASTTLWHLARHRLEAAFARPAVAVSYVTALIAMGLVLGAKQGQQQSARAEVRLEARYVQSIDPYRKLHAH